MRTRAQRRLIRQASSGPEDSADRWRRRLEEWMDELGRHPNMSDLENIPIFEPGQRDLNWTNAWNTVYLGQKRQPTNLPPYFDPP